MSESAESRRILVSLDFTAQCEFCSAEATHKMSHPEHVIHLICTKCAKRARDNLKFVILATCNICDRQSDRLEYSTYNIDEIVIESL